MNTTKAILCGALLWVLIFFEVSILMFGFKMQSGTSSYLITHYILLVILTAISAFVYFRGKIKKGVKSGLLLGIIFVVISAVLDSIITIPLFLNMNYYGFFISLEMLASYFLVLVVSMIMGMIKE